MLYWMCKISGEPPTWRQIEHCIRRNFGGSDIDVVEIFRKYVHLRSEPALSKEKYKQIWENKLKRKFLEDANVKRNFLEKFNEVHQSKFTEDNSAALCKKDFEMCFTTWDLKNEQLNQELHKECKIFSERKFNTEIWPLIINPSCDSSGLIKASLANTERSLHGESRYLLFLTENYSALQTLTHFLEMPMNVAGTEIKPPHIIFGSSFPKDRNLTQACRDINSIKLCMQTGRPVILLNLDHLYESLYDALNQHYVYFGDLRFIDLGLQNHRVKCNVHDDFKLILIAEKKKVCTQFPTPLINRLEKHFVVTSTVLTEQQLEVQEKIKKWIEHFLPLPQSTYRFQPKDSFVGFHDDTASTVVFQATRLIGETEKSAKILEKSKQLLLRTVTPDAVFRVKAKHTTDDSEYNNIVQLYQQQQQSSLEEFLQFHFSNAKAGCKMQVTTYNELLSEDEITKLTTIDKFKNLSVKSCVLEEFDTELEFTTSVREALQTIPSLLIIQCNSGHLKNDLIACAKYRIDDIIREGCQTITSSTSFCHVLLIVLIPREQNNSLFVGFLGGNWICAHIDELFPEYNVVSKLLLSPDISMSSLFYDGQPICYSSMEKHTETTDDIDRTKGNLNYYHHLDCLIQSAIHKAQSSNSSYEQMGNLLQLNQSLKELLSEDPPSMFFKNLVQHIWECMIKQGDMEPSKNWLMSVSLNPSKLAEGGGFQQVVLREIDEYIISVFAKIIFCISKASNLNLLIKSECMSKFWNAAFSCPAVCSFEVNEANYDQFNDHKPPLDYKCHLPFSWIIIDVIGKLFRNHLIFDSGTSNLIERMHSSITRTAVCELLNSVQEAEYEEIQDAYIMDLIQLCWVNQVLKDKTIRSERLKLLLYTLKGYVQKMNEVFPESSFAAFVCKSHYGIHQLHPVIKTFDRIIEVLPKLLFKIGSAFCDDTSAPPSMLLDDHACLLALSSLDTKNDVDEKKLVSKLHLFYQLSHVIDETVKSSKRLQEKSWDWLRIRTVHLFIEHVIMKFPQYLNTLVPYTNNIQRFMRKAQTKVDFLRQIENILNIALQKFSENHKKDTDSFIKHCTQFYMEVIIKLTTGEASVDEDLMEKLLQNIFTTNPEVGEKLGTRDLVPFLKLRSSKDSVPVLRSFLLQLLIRKRSQLNTILALEKSHCLHCSNSNFNRAQSLIEKYFDMANKRGYDTVHIRLLYCKLFEEAYHEKLLHKKSLGEIVDHLKAALKSFEGKESRTDITYLHWIGTARFILCYFSNLTHSKYFMPNCRRVDETFDIAFNELMPAVKKLCQRNECQDETQLHTGPQTLLLKLMYHQIGETGLKELHHKHGMNWIMPEAVHFTGEKDYFAIYGEPYTSKKTHTLMAGASLAENRDMVQNVQSAVLLGLCIFSEIAEAVGQPTADIQRRKTQQLCSYIRSCITINEELKVCIESLLTNTFCGQVPCYIEQLYMTPTLSQKNKVLSSIIVHIAIVLISKDNEGVFTLFHLLRKSPHEIKNYYLPTMPNEPFEFEGPMYESEDKKYCVCEFGHVVYPMMELGKSNHSTLVPQDCPTCTLEGKRVRMRGEKYMVSRTEIERSQTGYVLGVSTSSPSVPERQLTKASFLILQAILNSMFVWTLCNSQMKNKIQEISQVVKANITERNLPSFFWDHFVANIHDLQNAMSMSFEDTALLLHLVIQKIFEKPTVSSEFELTSKAGRNAWENCFDECYIQPVLKNSSKSIEDAQACMAEVVAKQQILNVVMEKDDSSFNLEHCLWKYHPQITVETVHQALKSSSKAEIYSSLDYFLKEEPSLRATKFLSSVVKFQQYMYHAHNCRFSRAEVRAIKIGDFIKEFNNEAKEKEFTNYLSDTSEAWDLVKGKLQNYGVYSLPENYVAMNFSMDTPVSYFIPSMTDEGRCTISLMEYLSEVHNKCIYQCESTITIMRRAGNTWKSLWRGQTVELNDVKITDLIVFEDRLKAIILAHSHYSLVIGQRSAEVEFDFAAMEKHILDEFVYTKPKIVKKGVNDVVSFREDVYEQNIFQNIQEKIFPQVDLTPAMKKDLISQLTRIQTLRIALDHMNIVIGFLSAGRKVSPQTSLVFYATEYLRITDFNRAVFCAFNLEHTLALWHVISLELAKKRTVSNLSESPFDVKNCFLKKLNDPTKIAKLKKCLETINVETILGKLNHFIETHVRNTNEKEAESMIHVCFMAHFKDLREDVQLFSKDCLIDIKMCYIVDVWKIMVSYQYLLKTPT